MKKVAIGFKNMMSDRLNVFLLGVSLATAVFSVITAFLPKSQGMCLWCSLVCVLAPMFAAVVTSIPLAKHVVVCAVPSRIGRWQYIASIAAQRVV